MPTNYTPSSKNNSKPQYEWKNDIVYADSYNTDMPRTEIQCVLCCFIDSFNEPKTGKNQDKCYTNSLKAGKQSGAAQNDPLYYFRAASLPHIYLASPMRSEPGKPLSPCAVLQTPSQKQGEPSTNWGNDDYDNHDEADNEEEWIDEEGDTE